MMRPPPLSPSCLLAVDEEGGEDGVDLNLPRRVMLKMAKKIRKKQKKRSRDGISEANELTPLEPTEVQRHVWPILLCFQRSCSASSQSIRRSRNLICIAPTGSGKTLAYGIPLIQNCAAALQNSTTGTTSSSNVLGLVLVPTRELALQVSHQLQKVVRAAQKELRGGVLDVVAVYGGVAKDDQIRRIIRGASTGRSGGDGQRGVVLVATTGRLVDLLGVDTNILQRTRFLVIDEADRMALSAEIVAQVDAIVAAMPIFPSMKSNSNEFASFCCLFSATLPQDNAVKAKFVDWVGGQATTIQLNVVSVGKRQTDARPATATDAVTVAQADESQSEKKRKAKQAGPLDVSSIPENIQQIVHVCSNHKKPKKLITMLHKIRKEESANGARSKGLCIVFFNRIKSIQYMLNALEKEGHKCAQLHSGMSQNVRELTVLNFKSGKVPTLLATDVAARGLHANRVQCVINYDFPASLGEYVHRCGRAGRNKEAATVYSYFNREMKNMAADLIELLNSAGAWVDPNLLALVPDDGSKECEGKGKKRRRKNTNKSGNTKKSDETLASAAIGRGSNIDGDGDDGEENDWDEDGDFSHLSGNRIVLKRASHVSDANDSGEEEEEA